MIVIINQKRDGGPDKRSDKHAPDGKKDKSSSSSSSSSSTASAAAAATVVPSKAKSNAGGKFAGLLSDSDSDGDN